MTESPQERNPFTRPGFVVAAALIALIVIGGIVLALSGAFTQPGDEEASSEPGQDATASPSPELAGGESVCGLEGVATSGSAETPPTVEWTTVGNFPVPGSDIVGPGKTTDDGLRTCYQRTPEGALVAAVNYLGASTDARLLVPAYEYSTAEGPGRKKAIALARQQDGAGSNRAEVVGYRVLGYDGETAKIDLALELASGQYLSMVNDMVWEDGDWKGVVTDEGTAPTQPSQIPDLNGYILWSAGA